jgi:hypothetical protein
MVTTLDETVTGVEIPEVFEAVWARRPYSSPMNTPRAGVVTDTSADGAEQPAELQAITR